MVTSYDLLDPWNVGWAQLTVHWIATGEVVHLVHPRGPAKRRAPPSPEIYGFYMKTLFYKTYICLQKKHWLRMPCDNNKSPPGFTILHFLTSDSDSSSKTVHTATWIGLESQNIRKYKDCMRFIQNCIGYITSENLLKPSKYLPKTSQHIPKYPPNLLQIRHKYHNNIKFS